MHYVPPSPGRRPGKPAPAARPARATGDHGSVLDAVRPCLTCAYCGAALARRGGSVRCAAGHVFDIARPGYVSLLPAGAKVAGGDTAAMVRARADFLAAGHFASLAAGLGQAASSAAAAGAPAGGGGAAGPGPRSPPAGGPPPLPPRAGPAPARSRLSPRR